MNGTFVAVKFHQDTRTALLKFAKHNNVPNTINEDELHCTVVYSKTVLESVAPRRSISPEWIGEPLHFEVFKTIEGKNCLVLRFSCGELYSRHYYLKHVKEATHGFPSYLPHITLSYDIGDFDISLLGDVKLYLPKILVVEEYSEENKQYG